MSRHFHSDFLVIGTGIAGLTAANQLTKFGSVHVLSKNAIKESNTLYAQGGIAVAMKEDDAPDFHLKDTLSAGAGLCNEEMVSILVKEGPERVQELIALGTQFDTEDGELSYTKEGAHSKRRILHAGDATGREIEKALGRQCLSLDNCRFFPHTTVLKLTKQNGRCTGCIAKGPDESLPLVFSAKAVLLATGGACQLFENNTNPPGATGEGMALALEAGAVLKDLEFVQFHPTTLYLGDKKPISLFLISEAVRGEGAILRNHEGYRFMPDYHPLAELAPRDIVSRAIFDQMQTYNQHCVYLDLSQLEVTIPKRFPTIYQRCLDAKIDITKDMIPVAPAAHYCIGGVETNAHAQTAVPGLYAAGEVAATGIHGANRLASNSLLEGLVFGHRAALAMSKESVCAIDDSPNERLAFSSVSNEKLTEIAIVRQKIRRLMWQHAGICRSETGLQTALDSFQKMAHFKKDPSFHESVLSLKHILTLAEKTCESALVRKDSVGAHYRLDAVSSVNIR